MSEKVAFVAPIQGRIQACDRFIFAYAPLDASNCSGTLNSLLCVTGDRSPTTIAAHVVLRNIYPNKNESIQQTRVHIILFVETTCIRSASTCVPPATLSLGFWRIPVQMTHTCITVACLTCSSSTLACVTEGWLRHQQFKYTPTATK